MNLRLTSGTLVSPAMTAASLLAAALFTSTASASISASDPFFTIRAQSGANVGIINVPLADVFSGDLDGDGDNDVFYWSVVDPTPIYQGVNATSGNVVATLVSIVCVAGRNNVAGENRHGIDVSFSLIAGSQTTHFDLISPLLSFTPSQNASATTSATLGGTDQRQSDFDNSGIQITPALPSGFAYTTEYNGGTNFRDYFNSPLIGGPADSVGTDGNMTPTGAWQPLNTMVSSMNMRFSFDVSANDAAAGTNTYSIVPSPSACVLIALPGLVMGRRRR